MRRLSNSTPRTPFSPELISAQFCLPSSSSAPAAAPAAAAAADADEEDGGEGEGGIQPPVAATTPFSARRGSSETVLSPNILAGAIDSQTIFVDENDMNPLKPCGACHEWLKKIAEVNPSFSVVTFTDHQCEGVYIEQIWE
jgi:hypothetical protein